MTTGNGKIVCSEWRYWMLLGVAALGGSGMVACGGSNSPSEPTPTNPGSGALPAVVSLLTDTGVDSSMCFATGNTTSWVSCSSAEARALNAQQDGMVGRDAAYPDASDGKLGFSYTKLDASGAALPASAAAWSCVKDNTTGLTWEIKTADGGLRDMSMLYTNYGDNRAGDASSFVTAVNAVGLCGHRDWRLPTLDELQSIVDYGRVNPAIDTAFFINTPPAKWGGVYWDSAATYCSSSPVAGDPASAWCVDFFTGVLVFIGRNSVSAVRLVR